MNFKKLTNVIREKGDTQQSLAEAIGLSRVRLNAKINGRASFTQPEICAIKKRYDLSCSEIDEIFFTCAVS